MPFCSVRKVIISNVNDIVVIIGLRVMNLARFLSPIPTGGSFDKILERINNSHHIYWVKDGEITEYA